MHIDKNYHLWYLHSKWILWSEKELIYLFAVKLPQAEKEAREILKNK